MAANHDDVLRQLADGGLVVDALEIGRLVRCRTADDRRGQRSGWYSLHEFTAESGETLIVGAYGDWRGGVTHKIRLDRKHSLTPDERAAIRKRMAAERRRAEAERKRRAEAAARTASRLWREQCGPVERHDYLERKQIGAHGARASRKGALVVPLCDVHGGIHGLEFILSRERNAQAIERLGRDKTFYPSGLAKRGRFYMEGAPRPGGVLLLAEGFATFASLREATGLPAACAFDAGNLEPVAEALAKHYRGLRILICADDDHTGKCRACGKFTPVAEDACAHCGKPHGKHNTGVAKASASALAVDGAWIAPVFAERRRGCTDWNDLACVEGLHVVRGQIEAMFAELGWDAPAAEVLARGAISGGAGSAAGADDPPCIHVDEAVRRYVIIRNVKDTMFDTVRCELLPRSCVLDYVTPDHAWRDWKTRPERRNAFIEQVGFDPAGEDPNIICNMWRGWPTTPSGEGSCERLLELLGYMCSAEDNPRDVYRWVIRWLAYPIQHPGAKMKSALVVHGPQGVGKNMLFEAVMAIYGEYGRIIGQAEIEEKFNDWVSRKLFLIANEIIARQELFHQKNKVKALITDDWVRVNPKNVAAHDERNHINLVFLSNELQPVVVEPDDRRFMVIWTPPKRSHAFYKAVLDEIRHGGIAALHRHLLDVDLGDFHPGAPPLYTRARGRLIELSKESPDRFADEWLDGALDWPANACALADLYTAYVRWCRAEGERFAYARNRFSARLAMRDGIDITKKPVMRTGGNPQVMRVVLPEGDEKPADQTWMSWLAGRVSDFRQKINDRDEF